MTTQMKTYQVTITPKYPTARHGRNAAWHVLVQANSKREANKRARRQLENEGHIFTHSDAATFTAHDVTQTA
jgi:hypothetical protein